MKIIAVDDEKLALDDLVCSIKEADHRALVKGFQDILEAMDYVDEHKVDVAFLDIHMRQMDGIAAAKEMKTIYPKINIIFVTGFEDYREQAMRMHASGYVEKPATAQKIREQLDNLLYTPPLDEMPVYARTFGSFELLIKGKPVHFNRAKSKELLAYLVDQMGDEANRRQLAEVVLECTEYDRRAQQYLSVLFSDLMHTLRDVGAQDIVIKKWNAYAIDMDELHSDLFDYAKGLPDALNAYQGEYMKGYEWGEGRIEDLSF